MFIFNGGRLALVDVGAVGGAVVEAVTVVALFVPFNVVPFLIWDNKLNVGDGRTVACGFVVFSLGC
jgi:hypothetical protein